nr:radical SAM protein [Anaerolineae bacterium]
MVINGQYNNTPVAIHRSPRHLVISIGPPEQSEVFSYDLAGRLWSAYVHGRTFRRAMNGQVQARWTAQDGQRRRHWVLNDEANDLITHVCQAVCSLKSWTNKGCFFTPLPREWSEALDRACEFDIRQHQDDAAVFRKIYKPIGILPPDQYMALVVQMTEGCSFNTCTFCNFYKDRPFRIKPPVELTEHIREIKEHLGDGITMRRSVFLADANALVIPMKQLVERVSIVNQQLNTPQNGYLFSFLDAFSGTQKSRADYAALKELGLRRIYIGLESGHNDLLRFLNKPGTAEEALEAVNTMKSSGINVGVIVLIGAGGHVFSEAHIADTASVINQMRLDSGDFLYFSELVTTENLPYTLSADTYGIRPLSPDECQRQTAGIRRHLRFDGKSSSPRISRYDVLDFIY